MEDEQSKFPPLSSTSLPELRKLFRSVYGSWIACSSFTQHYRVHALKADEIMRECADAGYLEFDAQRFGWKISPLGASLATNKLVSRFDKKTRDTLIRGVLKRARKINQDSLKLYRIHEIKLFGSALHDDREDYGDVDLEYSLVKRALTPEQEEALIEGIAPKVPEYYIKNTYGWDAAIQWWESVRARAELTNRSKRLSVSMDSIEYLGCEHKTIYKFDSTLDAEAEFDSSIHPRTQPMPEVKASDLPSQTVIRPVGLITDPNATLNTGYHRTLRFENIFELTGGAWAGYSQDGQLHPIELSDGDERATSDAIFCCDLWQDQSLSGIELMNRLDKWVKEQDVPLQLGELVFVSAGPRGIKLRPGQGTEVRISNGKLKGAVLAGRESWQGSITQKHLAARFCQGIACERMLRELSLSGPCHTRIVFNPLAHTGNSSAILPSLNGLLKKFRETSKAIPIPDDVLNRALSEEAPDFVGGPHVLKASSLNWDEDKGLVPGLLVCSWGDRHLYYDDVKLDQPPGLEDFSAKIEPARKELEEALLNIPSLEEFSLSLSEDVYLEDV